MKAVILLLLAGVALALGKPPEIILEPNKEDDRDYAEQLVKKFNALLESDKNLKDQFAAFEAAPKELAGVRYRGSVARPLLLHQSMDVDFRDAGGRQDYTQTVVIYYSFAEGHHKGIEETSGIFAVFSLVGHQTFDHKGGNDFELVKHTVTAKFRGFQKVLNAEQTGSSDGDKPPN